MTPEQLQFIQNNILWLAVTAVFTISSGTMLFWKLIGKGFRYYKNREPKQKQQAIKQIQEQPQAQQPVQQELKQFNPNIDVAYQQLEKNYQKFQNYPTPQIEQRQGWIKNKEGYLEWNNPQ